MQVTPQAHLVQHGPEQLPYSCQHELPVAMLPYIAVRRADTTEVMTILFQQQAQAATES